jgi:hypothetical protein
VLRVTVQFKAAAQKSELLLASRLEDRTFVVFHEREKEEIKCIKEQATTRIKSLEKQHGVQLSQVESKLYRKDCIHTKKIVTYKSTIESLICVDIYFWILCMMNAGNLFASVPKSVYLKRNGFRLRGM